VEIDKKNKVINSKNNGADMQRENRFRNNMMRSDIILQDKNDNNDKYE
jgi:hypothetical protein